VSRIARIAVLLAVILSLLLSGCSPASGTASVIRVTDGDTITIGSGHRVRYIGIDAPEVYPKVEAYGMEAWQANRKLVEGKEVRLDADVTQTDRYGRLLRYVYVDDVFVNAELVRLGLVRVKAYPPNTKYQDFLEEVERQAKQAGRGIWSK